MASLEPLSALAARPPQDPSATSSAQRTQPIQPSASGFNATEKQPESSVNPTSLTALPQGLTRPKLSTSTSSNYAQVLEEATAKKNASSQSNRAGNSGQGGTESGDMKVDTGSTVPGDDISSPSSATWRPKFDRQQSWSQQDRKRAMQEGLMSPVADKEMGFSSAKDGKFE